MPEIFESAQEIRGNSRSEETLEKETGEEISDLPDWEESLILT